MNASADKNQFEQAAIEMAIDASMVEKDWWVTQVLAFLSENYFPGFEIVFSGGTALSKAHRIIQRFSEDIDFRVIATLEGSQNQQRQKLSDFKHEVVAALRQAGFKVSNPEARDNNRYFTFDIEYATLFNPHNSLRPHIKLEIKVATPQLPVMKMPVQSFVSKLAKEEPEVKAIACIDPLETAADKLSALAWRIMNRERSDAHDDPSLVRHIHDLAALERIVENDARFPGLVIASMQLDKDTLLKNKPAFGLSIAEKFVQMLDTLKRDTRYQKEYQQFVNGVSYAQEGMEPDFAKALKALIRLTQTVLMADAYKKIEP